MPGGSGEDAVYCGTVVHSTATNPLEILENAALGVRQGKVSDPLRLFDLINYTYIGYMFIISKRFISY
jgi:hypothetical protein